MLPRGGKDHVEAKRVERVHEVNDIDRAGIAVRLRPVIIYDQGATPRVL